MLTSSVLAGPVDEFIEANFSEVDLKDKRREKRLRQFAHGMALEPGASIPKLMPNWSATKSIYRLLAHKSASPETLQAGHRSAVRSTLEKAPTGSAFLLFEDTSEIDFSGRQEIEGLGPVGPSNKGRQGFHLHTVVAACLPAEGVSRPGEAGHLPLELLGIAHQEYYIRKLRPKGEPRSCSYKSQQRERESDLFLRSSDSLGKPAEGVQYWRIADRAADVFLTLANYQIHNHDFVVRALHNRCLEEEQPKLFDFARGLKPFDGEAMIRLRSRPGRAARDARLRFAAAPVTLSVPHLPPKAREQLSAPIAPIKCTIIRVFEENPPAAKPQENAGTKMEKNQRPSERVEWFLLTSATVETSEQAHEIAGRYSSRWIIEEYHRALKEGLGAERIQLESKDAIFAAIAIKCILALRLVALKERVRITPDAPASEADLSDLEIKVLEYETKRKIKTVRDAILAIGRLGGHLNRKSDGMPGYKTLMRGLEKLTFTVKGVLIAQALAREDTS